jgi:hypothetical protein
MIKLISQYLCEIDGGGDRAVVREFQEFIEVETNEGREFIAGRKFLELDDGTALSPGDEDDTFRTTDRQTVYRRVKD